VLFSRLNLSFYQSDRNSAWLSLLPPESRNHNRLLVSVTIFAARKPHLCQAAGLKRVIIDSGADSFALDSPTLSQTSRNAFARSSTSRSLWKGVGVMRSRSVPRGTVG
jgi:hypothetical protein